MSGTVSTRWFWSDWMSDPGLRACSYAARGLWKDLLCIAGSNKAEYGFVSLNGRKLDAGGIAKMTNGTVEEVEVLLVELADNGVFSRDRRGVIYCRRMLRAEKNRTNGRLGGNPNLLKNKEKSDSVKPNPKPLIPEPEPEPSKVRTPAPAEAGLFPVEASSQTDWPKDHYRDLFWQSYPRRTEKKAALAKLDAIRKGGNVSWGVLFAGVLRYAKQMRGTEDRYIKHPTTWLNRGCWDDEFAPSGGASPAGGSRNGVASLLAQMTKGRRHDDDEGLEPGRTLPAH